MYGYLNLETAEKGGDIAVIVTGVKNIDDMLTKAIVASTSFAQKFGIKSGTVVLNALEKIA